MFCFFTEPIQKIGNIFQFLSQIRSVFDAKRVRYSTPYAIDHVVKLSLDIISSFSLNHCLENNGSPLSAVVKKEIKKSPSTLQRDRQRRAAFLLKKASSSEICCLMAQEHSLPKSPVVTTSQCVTIPNI